MNPASEFADGIRPRRGVTDPARQLDDRKDLAAPGLPIVPELRDPKADREKQQYVEKYARGRDRSGDEKAGSPREGKQAPAEPGLHEDMLQTAGGGSQKSDPGPTPAGVADLAASAAPRLIEKYLQASDFIGYILDNRDLFLEEELKHVRSKEEENKIVMDMLIKFMLEV